MLINLLQILNIERMIIHVKSVDEFKAAINSPTPVLVDFFASWCPPCKGIAPILERFAKKYNKAKLYKVDFCFSLLMIVLCSI